jgi:hypothetical protein
MPTGRVSVLYPPPLSPKDGSRIKLQKRLVLRFYNLNDGQIPKEQLYTQDRCFGEECPLIKVRWAQNPWPLYAPDIQVQVTIKTLRIPFGYYYLIFNYFFTVLQPLFRENIKSFSNAQLKLKEYIFLWYFFTVALTSRSYRDLVH